MGPARGQAALPEQGPGSNRLDSRETKTKRHTSSGTEKCWTKVTHVLLHTELNSRENPKGTETKTQRPGLPEGVPWAGGRAQCHAQDADLGSMPAKLELDSRALSRVCVPQRGPWPCGGHSAWPTSPADEHDSQLLPEVTLNPADAGSE